MALLGIKYFMGLLNQGNDDTKCTVSSSHVNTEAEATALAELFTHNGEFGEEMISFSKDESAPSPVVEFTAETKLKLKGLLTLELIFENGKKEKIKFNNYFNDEDLIKKMVDAIKLKPAGAFGTASVVSVVNTSFSVPRKSK